MDTVEAVLNRWQEKMNIDAVILDSLDLIDSPIRRQSKRDEMNEVIIAGKHLAMSFNGGIPVITPWQTTRQAYNEVNGDLGGG